MVRGALAPVPSSVPPPADFSTAGSHRNPKTKERKPRTPAMGGRLSGRRGRRDVGERETWARWYIFGRRRGGRQRTGWFTERLFRGYQEGRHGRGVGHAPEGFPRGKNTKAANSRRRLRSSAGKPRSGSSGMATRRSRPRVFDVPLGTTVGRRGKASHRCAEAGMLRYGRIPRRGEGSTWIVDGAWVGKGAMGGHAPPGAASSCGSAGRSEGRRRPGGRRDPFLQGRDRRWARLDGPGCRSHGPR